MPGASLAPFVYPDRRQDLQQKPDHCLPPFLHPRRPDGHDKPAAIGIADQTGHAIPLCVYQTKGVRIRRDDLTAQGKGPFYPPPPEAGVDPGGGIVGQEAEGDIAGTVKSEGKGPAGDIRRKNDVSGSGFPLHGCDGPGEEPGVTMTERDVATFFKYDPRVIHATRPTRTGSIFILFTDATTYRLNPSLVTRPAHRAGLPGVDIFK